jgi:hypothetical protein
LHLFLLQEEGKNMRGHIIGLSKLLMLFGIAVTAMTVILMAGNIAGLPQLGEAVPDAIANGLRGGDAACWSDFTKESCKTLAGDACATKTPCNMTTYVLLMNPSTTGIKGKDFLCCGTMPEGGGMFTCTMVPTKTDTCETSGP